MAKISKQHISRFQKQILAWYDSNGRNFPWRVEGLSPYQIIISETLLQRTKAETVAGFYRDFLKKYPSWKSLANAKRNELEKQLQPLGLYKQRASRLSQLAKEMVKRKGRLPRNRDELESIPFLGQYIVNAIELQIFQKPSPLLDVNMARVLERYFGERKLADIRYDPYLQELAYRVVDHPRSKFINWAVLDFAALVCKARKPFCDICKLNQYCNFLK